jgi:hypothetical protein
MRQEFCNQTSVSLCCCCFLPCKVLLPSLSRKMKGFFETFHVTTCHHHLPVSLYLAISHQLTIAACAIIDSLHLFVCKETVLFSWVSCRSTLFAVTLFLLLFFFFFLFLFTTLLLTLLGSSNGIHKLTHGEFDLPHLFTGLVLLICPPLLDSLKL